ncbi:MAG TPA: tetraacyldisaccharide 4'-kinase [Rubrivivax sp.]
MAVPAEKRPLAGLRGAIERSWWQPRTSALTLALLPLSWLYGAAWHLRRLLFAAGLLRAGRVPVPVLVVGNLIAGGAGKTPTVIALIAALRRDGWNPGVISRGYGSSATVPAAVARTTLAADCGDEPLLIHLRSGAPVWVGQRRAAVARALCAANPTVDIVLADDGLQHLALHRDAQVVVFDERGVGNGRLLPAGPLRQPMAALPPTRTVVIYNAEAPTTPWPGLAARRRLAGSLPLAEWWAGAAPRLSDLQSLAAAPLTAAAGMAVPERFFSMLEAAGLTIQRLPLPDHAAFEPRPWAHDAGTVVLTEKDAVKIPADVADAGSIHVATLDFELPASSRAALAALLGPLKAPKKAKRAL